MACLLMSAVFLLCAHISVCQNSRYFWFNHENFAIKCQVKQDDDVTTFPARYEQGELRDVCSPDGSPVPERKINGPPFLVTDGHALLNLTMDSPGATSYLWFTPGKKNARCSTSLPNCSFTPTVEDDGKNVTCVTTNRTNNAINIGYYTIDLKYPPQAEPAIDPKPKGKKVEAGSEIECTVSGGKPPVANVTLTCLQEQFRVDNRTEGNSVSSFIKVASTIQMVCTCSAYWEPEPELYRNTTRKEFPLPITCKQPASRASGLLVAAMTLFVILCAI